jgi:N-acetylglucosaminyl-diphospho-decaprenol L-rhamnosyltransferase
MSEQVTIVLVHYQTPELAAEAVAALDEDLAQSGIAAQRIVVDNGSDEAGRALLAELPVELVEPGKNLGYARGANAGAELARADTLVLMNCDVLVVPGCLAGLLEQLDRGVACAGPRFVWDRGGRFLLPPTERRRRLDELAAAAASRGRGWSKWARRRSRSHSWRHWFSDTPVPSYDLSGSLLAIRRDAWKQLGGFDPAYTLYFEETDWLMRLRRAHLPAVYVPAANAVHLYAQSSLTEPRAAKWFEESADRFRRRAYGGWFSTLLEGVGRWASRSTPLGLGDHVGDLTTSLPLLVAGRQVGWVEVSPNPTGFPAAAERIEGRPAGASWTLPDEIAAGVPGGSSLWIRLCDEAGSELACHRLEKPLDSAR